MSLSLVVCGKGEWGDVNWMWNYAEHSTWSHVCFANESQPSASSVGESKRDPHTAKSMRNELRS